jgi:hypothetical protein
MLEDSIPPWWVWANWSSPLKYCFTVILINEFENVRFDQSREGNFRNGNELLKFYGIHDTGLKVTVAYHSISAYCSQLNSNSWAILFSGHTLELLLDSLLCSLFWRFLHWSWFDLIKDKKHIHVVSLFSAHVVEYYSWVLFFIDNCRARAKRRKVQ